MSSLIALGVGIGLGVFVAMVTAGIFGFWRRKKSSSLLPQRTGSNVDAISCNDTEQVKSTSCGITAYSTCASNVTMTGNDSTQTKSISCGITTHSSVDVHLGGQPQKSQHNAPPNSAIRRGSVLPVEPSATISMGSAKSHPSQPHGIPMTLPYRTFTYKELALATNEFSVTNLLGQGGFGYVYKGILPNGKEVAVKQLKTGSHQGEREFRAEVETIGGVHHRHLVSLLGYCISGEQRILVYDFIPNKTLEFHLHGKGSPLMSWPTRLKIALGSAKGLAYLHEDCECL